jgi:hypothetical protein
VTVDLDREPEEKTGQEEEGDKEDENSPFTKEFEE